MENPKAYTYLGGLKLSHGISLDIVNENGTKTVFINSMWHTAKRWPLSFSFSEAFSDSEILYDAKVITQIEQAIGNDILYRD